MLRVDASLTFFTEHSPLRIPRGNQIALKAGNFEIFPGISHRPQLQKARSVLQTPALSTLTPMYVEEVELTTNDLREQIDGENVSRFDF